MDIREPIAKMRLQARLNRDKAAELEAEAQRITEAAKAEYERIAADAQAKVNEIMAAATAQSEEAAYWESLAAEQERRAGLTPLDTPSTDQPVAGGGVYPPPTAPMTTVEPAVPDPYRPPEPPAAPATAQDGGDR